MSGAIGYYVHHHGRGHRERAMAIASCAPERFVLIGTGLGDLPAPFQSLDLVDDRPAGGDAAFAGADGAETRPDALHYAPIAHDGVRERSSAMAGWIARERPALMVIDVSVEAAMLARLCATPTVYVRLAGRRDDPAHSDAFRGACALLAPFHPDLDDLALTDWVRTKSRHFAGLTPPQAEAEPDDDVVLVALGSGGADVSVAQLADAARATPHLAWRVIGPIAADGDVPDNLTVIGWVDEPGREIARAGIVVAGAGDGMLNAIAAAGRPYVCVPEARPYGEQRSKARRLGALGGAVVLDGWPAPERWSAILDDARRLDVAGLRRLHDPHGPAKAAAFLMEMAAR